MEFISSFLFKRAIVDVLVPRHSSLILAFAAI